MKESIKQHKQYTPLSGDYQLPLTIDFEISVALDDSVQLLSHILEDLNYIKLYQAYSHKGRKAGIKPRILFKVIVCVFMEGIYSTQDIEKACKRDENLFVNGTKIEANANKYTFVWKKVVHKNKEKMHLKIIELFKQIEENVTFIHGIGKRKSVLQKPTECIKVCLK